MELKNCHRHWLLLRGLGRDKRHWGKFVDQFQQALPYDSVTAIDTLGNGEFSQNKSPLAIADYTDHCREQVLKKRQELPQQLDLVALSLGGMIALDWAQRYPQEIASITLINTSVANLTPWYQRIKLVSLTKLLLAVLINSRSDMFEKVILQQTSNLALAPSVLSQWLDYYMQSHTSRRNLIRQLIAASQFRLTANLNVAPLVLASSQDRIVNCQASKDIQQFSEGEIFLHPSAGHDLTLDDGDWVIRHIQQQIEKRVDIGNNKTCSL
ncbi:alpha/beta hydrolase [Thalassotalea insulae]|uniref:Alpha/beta hydrolase n=1 Tax=Thalassotalea insulae TaxID=2056778 RepID=A0ABQ6H1K4_9GAMM|nr:alpha/beta hydrolase [Thalassotalea insulae]GLX80301.1 alpha/beta hydrolase [Thalassotalea insulae]